MNVLAVAVFGLFGAAFVLLGAWLLATGQNLPGILGRGFTQGDNLRMKRAPAIYFRVIGAFAAVTGLFGFFMAWTTTIFPKPSATSLIVFLALLSVFLIAISGLLAWLLILAARHRLFRWDKP